MDYQQENKNLIHYNMKVNYILYPQRLYEITYYKIYYTIFSSEKNSPNYYVIIIPLIFIFKYCSICEFICPVG